MFHLNQVSLLSVLLVICHVLTESRLVEHSNMLVSRGDSIVFTCNISTNEATQINWTKGRFYFAHSMTLNWTFSNFTSDTVRIDPEFPFKLNILNAQHDDAGLYTCDVTGSRVAECAVWNLTVSEKPEEKHQVDYIQKSRGDSIMFTCNISVNRSTQISWTKGRFYFVHSMILNRTFSNFTSDTVRIDPEFRFNLNILNAQHDDAGLYTCVVTDDGGVKSTVWNLTVSEKPEEILSSFLHSWYFKYILAPVSALFLCGIILVVCYYRKLKTRRPNQDPVEMTVQSQGQVVPPPVQDHTDRRRKNKRSQYIERLNSIYDIP